ncbi:unnamed protein product [Coffea canephora]|uniref:Uncharacterized protein n=1 Tax=Coffea canephora TaxID=49390 RepID=A0A068VA22_COFCA|nr:unnamed protein product [Coffea canephora]
MLALMKWTPLEEGFYLYEVTGYSTGAITTYMSVPVDMVKIPSYIAIGI